MAIINEKGEIIIPVSSSKPETVHPQEMISSEQEGKESHPEDGVETGVNDSMVQNAKTGHDAVAGYVDQLQRLQAEFSNYKRRVEKERESMAMFGKQDMASKLLPVLDDLERLIDHHQGEVGCSLEGVQLIHGNLVKVLTEEGLEIIPALGNQFNPEIHEAVSMEEVGAENEGLVVEEWMKGYRFAGKLLRPSRVKVGG